MADNYRNSYSPYGYGPYGGSDSGPSPYPYPVWGGGWGGYGMAQAVAALNQVVVTYMGKIEEIDAKVQSVLEQ